VKEKYIVKRKHRWWKRNTS